MAYALESSSAPNGIVSDRRNVRHFGRYLRSLFADVCGIALRP
jgi:hypothetical protein